MNIKILFLLFLIQVNLFTIEYYPKELDIKETPLSDVFAHLAKHSKYTIIGDSYINNLNVDGYFKKGTSIEEILEVLQKTYGLNRVKSRDTIIFRGRKSENKDMLVGKVIDQNTNQELEGVKIVLKRGENLEYYSGEQGEYIVDNIVIGAYFISVLSSDYSYDGDFIEVKEGINRFDIYVRKKNKKKSQNIEEERHQKNKKDDIIENISLENLSHTEIEKILKETFEEKLKISTSPGNNSIILFGKGEYIYSAKNLIKKLDRRKKQVRVTAEIIDVKENLFESLGFTWAYNSQKNLTEINNGLSVGALTGVSVDGLGEILGSSLNFVGKFNNGDDVLSMTLNLLETTQDLKINALPSIILLNGESGLLKMIEEVIVGEEKQESNNNDIVNYEPIFKEAGIILKVLPLIKEDESIYLEIDLEASDFKLKKSFKPDNENSGTFNSDGGSKVSRNLKTKVRLKNKDTILIGGLKRKIDQKINSKLPFIGDVPVVGNLFKNKTSRLENTDLYIKLKAEIIEENLR
ncbi:type II secretion system protein GspD [uncultured Cetobacterium sp.]|uniref:type II secretion system protein GspD n=1 Tax=uncultured Cetobacterium sp. TaxID=527638 RepID=UPI00260D5F1C|nr:secretin N-terminal domain-containing protein [uncultured Cetobacterium sp.]